MFISLNYLLLDLLDIRTWLFVSLLPPNDLIEKHTAQSGKRERGEYCQPVSSFMGSLPCLPSVPTLAYELQEQLLNT